MAVLHLLPGLQASIYIEGQPAQEYDDEEEKIMPDSTTKYIEAISGAKFAVRYWFRNDFETLHSVVAKVDLDGKYADGSCHDMKTVKRDDYRHIKSRRERIGDKHFESDFRFASLTTDDSDPRGAAKELQKALKDVGTITVRFYWANIGEHHAASEFRRDIKDMGTIPEKALKGKTLSHQASFNDRKTIAAFQSVHVDYLNGGKPFATFNFKYRSRAALKSLLIIPRSPSPVPLEERDVDTLSPQEMRELLRRQRERDEATQVVKREGGVKRERGRERSSTADGATYDDDELSFVSAKRRRLPVTLDEDGVETIDLT